MPCAYVLTCEHASNAIPRQFYSLFPRKVLATHRGYDIGAKEYAQALACATGWPLFCGLYTRLLVDLNRSTRLFHSKGLDVAAREYIKKTYYQPFRSEVFGWIQRQISSGKRVIHLSCHSFTPTLNGVVRPMDVGLLYDPRRKSEREFAEGIKQTLRSETSMSVRANAPYKGISDGHVAALRKRFSSTHYIGLEIEVNQSLLCPPRRELWRHVWLLRLIEALTQDTEE